MWCSYVTKNFNYIKIILVTTIFGGLSVLSPSYWISLQIVYKDLKKVEKWNDKVKCEIFF